MRHNKRRPDSTSERLKLGMCLNHIGLPKAIQCSAAPCVKTHRPAWIGPRLTTAAFSMRCRAAIDRGQVDKAGGLKD